MRNVNLHKDFQIMELQDHIRTLATNFDTSLHKSSDLQQFKLHILRPLSQKRFKRGRPHDLIS